MKKFTFIFILFYQLTLNAQSTYTISGYVNDSISGEDLIGASVIIYSKNLGIATNNYGFYSLTLPQGDYIIEYSYVGYSIKKISVSLTENIKKNISLSNSAYTIESVLVTADKNEISTQCKRMSLKQIDETPTSFGVPDVIKVMQLQPGIKNIGDGSSGMYVRGGNRDQNMVYIDEASIYNVSHLYGYISTFNPTMLKDVTFYNSYIPSEFGGRISSVLDTKMKEGNMNKFGGDIGLSTLTANASIEGPIIKDKSSFFIAGRKSTLDLLLNTPNESYSIPKFYDINAKMNFKINDNNRMYLSFYNGNDLTKTEDYYNNSQNLTSTLRWNYIVNPKIFINTSYVYSKYENKTVFYDTAKTIGWLTGVNENILKTKLLWYANSSNKLSFGFSSTYHQLTPGYSGDTTTSISKMQLLESATYIEHDKKFGKYLTLIYGLHYTMYQNIGSARWYSLNENFQPYKINTESKGIWNSYQLIEPRININFKKGKHIYSYSYTRTSQGMQILSNTALSYTTIETWISTSPNTKPLISNNFALGYIYQKKSYNLMSEVYYRAIQNQIDYIDHAQLFGNPYIESQIRTGTANAYGIETSLNKTEGKTRGSISYTFSRIWYNIPGITVKDSYRALYDIPHDVKIQISQQIGKHFSSSALWVFSSGRPATFPIGYYNANNKRIPIYSTRNSDSFPNYHRLDINLAYEPKVKKHIKQTITLGLCNVYGRINPRFYDFSINWQNNTITAYHFYTFMPSLTYKATIF